MSAAEEDWPRALRNTYGSLAHSELDSQRNDPRIKHACKLAVDALANLLTISAVVECDRKIERAEKVIELNRQLKEELQR